MRVTLGFEARRVTWGCILPETTPAITIITPAFAAELSLPRVLASVGAQSMRRWEHVIVIDGATDGSEGVARAAAASDPRIRVIVQPNAGASAARNTGLAVAKGEWILFLDADDTIDRSHLTRMLNRARGDGADIVCCGYVRKDAAGRDTERYPAPKLGDSPFRSIVASPPTAIHGIVARRDLLRAVGGFDSTLRTNEDWDLWLRVARSGARFAREPRLLAHYWNAETSLTRDAGSMMRDVVVVLERARARDARVLDPIPEFAEGIEIDSFDQNILSCALWSAAAQAGGGGDGLAAIRELPERLEHPWNREGLAGTIVDGLMVGAGGRYADIAGQWAVLAPRLETIFTEVQRRCGGDGLAYALMRDVEWEVARNGRLHGRRSVGKTYSVTLTPFAFFSPIEPPEDAEAVLLRFPLLPASGFLVLQAPALGRLAPAEVRRTVCVQLKRRFQRLAWRAHKRFPAVATLIDYAMTGYSIARRLLLRTPMIVPVEAEVQPDEPVAGEGTTETWDAFFGAEDPWNYQSPYEQLKYQRTVDMLPDRPIGRAIELACAEGMFTKLLAPKVGQLRATDISSIALQRAEARLNASGLNNVDYAVLDFFNQPIGENWDLVVSSEVLYYMTDEAQLEAYASKVAEALAPDGVFLHAHAFEVSDDASHTGFDWDDPFGADTMSRVFQAQPALTRVDAVVTDLYRIELYARVDPGTKPPPVEDRILPLGTDLEPWVAAMVVWNGAIHTRTSIAKQERAFRVPVLMYHRISDEGPDALSEWRSTPHDFEQQLRYLRRRGYRSIHPDELENANRRSSSMRGRPILITFDDAYSDFYDHAWPILERNGFSAHVFVVTGKVGQTADWDAGHGSPAPLMSWEQIVDLQGRGATFGSHLDLHRAADQLPVRELLREAQHSRAILEERLGVPVTTVAPPFGAMNIRVEQVLQHAGYTRIFDAQGGIAPLWGSRWKVPRIDVAGYDDLDSLAAKIGFPAEPPGPEDHL